MPPRSAYLLLEDQPANTTLYTPSDDKARTNSSPMLRSLMMIPGATGSTANAINAVSMMMAGARIKTALSANGGTQSSFMKILTPSATTWSSPKGPTRFGPYRSCHKASSRRSSQMSPAAVVSAAKRMPRTESIGYGLVTGSSRSFPMPANSIRRSEAPPRADRQRHMAGLA